MGICIDILQVVDRLVEHLKATAYILPEVPLYSVSELYWVQYKFVDTGTGSCSVNFLILHIVKTCVSLI